jgi:hypothetical protein
MYAKELKAQVQHDAYVVNTHLVAEALLRAAVAERAGAPRITPRDARGHAAGVPPRRPRFQN